MCRFRSVEGQRLTLAQDCILTGIDDCDGPPLLCEPVVPTLPRGLLEPGNGTVIVHVGDAVSVLVKDRACRDIIVAGILAYRGMAREVFPEFSMGEVQVRTLYPGAAPEDVERLVSLPIEEALDGLDGRREGIGAPKRVVELT